MERIEILVDFVELQWRQSALHYYYMNTSINNNADILITKIDVPPATTSTTNIFSTEGGLIYTSTKVQDSCNINCLIENKNFTSTSIDLKSLKTSTINSYINDSTSKTVISSSAQQQCRSGASTISWSTSDNFSDPIINGAERVNFFDNNLISGRFPNNDYKYYPRISSSLDSAMDMTNNIVIDDIFDISSILYDKTILNNGSNVPYNYSSTEGNAEKSTSREENTSTRNTARRAVQLVPDTSITSNDYMNLGSIIWDVIVDFCSTADVSNSNLERVGKFLRETTLEDIEEAVLLSPLRKLTNFLLQNLLPSKQITLRRDTSPKKSSKILSEESSIKEETYEEHGEDCRRNNLITSNINNYYYSSTNKLFASASYPPECPANTNDLDCLWFATDRPCNPTRHRVDTVWLIHMGIRVVAMQAGFGMLEAGNVGRIHTTDVMVKNIMDLVAGPIIYFLFGYQLSYGKDANGEAGPMIGSFSSGLNIPVADMGYWFFQFSFAATSTTIVSGMIAGRATIPGYFISSFFYHWDLISHCLSLGLG